MLRLDQEVQKLDSENADLKNDKNTLEADKEELKTENTGLEADLSEEKKEVNKLNTDISELKQSHLGEVHVMRLQLSEKDKDIRKMVISVYTRYTVYTRYIMPFQFHKRSNVIYKVNRKAIKNLLCLCHINLFNEYIVFNNKLKIYV